MSKKALKSTKKTNNKDIKKGSKSKKQKDTSKSSKSSSKKKRFNKKYAAALFLPTLLLGLLLIGSGITLLFPDQTLVFLKNNIPDVFNFFITEETPEIDKSDWVKVDEDDWVPPEQQNSGEVKTNYEEQKTMLAIPSANIEIPVVEGETEDAMYRGAWHFPTSTQINSPGNVVIFAHRFYKVPPAKDTFYTLDKVKVGDSVTITNKNGEVYNYQVIESKVVAKNDRSILNNTTSEILTLVTCTPLWTSEQRLVVIAKRI